MQRMRGFGFRMLGAGLRVEVGGLGISKAHRLLYHSTLKLEINKEEK